MNAVKKRIGWSAAAVAALVGFVLLAVVAPAPTRQAATNPATAELAGAVSAVNELSDAVYGEYVGAWRQSLQSPRSPERLGAFVDELLGIQQKFQQALGLFNSGRNDAKRAEALFRQHIIDDGILVENMLATVDDYEQFLFQQDRELIEAARISHEQWSQIVGEVVPNPGYWRETVRLVLADVLSESRKDGARFAGVVVISDILGSLAQNAAREAGLDTTEKGTLRGWAAGNGYDFAVEGALEHATDQTARITKGLDDSLARAEYELLDGDFGLFTVLRQMKEAHETARTNLVAPTQQ
jgi:hypothetical protein